MAGRKTAAAIALIVILILPAGFGADLAALASAVVVEFPGRAEVAIGSAG